MKQHEAQAHDEAADVRLKTCPECGSGEHVEISAGRKRGEWSAECTTCGVVWSFTDS